MSSPPETVLNHFKNNLWVKFFKFIYFQIKPKVSLPVGKNLQDHITTGLDLILLNVTLPFSWKSIINSLQNTYQYIAYGSGNHNLVVSISCVMSPNTGLHILGVILYMTWKVNIPSSTPYVVSNMRNWELWVIRKCKK